MTDEQRLAQTVRRLRERAGLSLRDIEEATDGRLSRGSLSNIESGKRRPKPETLRLLAEVLGADASELLTAAGHTPTRAAALPALKPYLRAKYGHLPAAARNDLAEYLERLEAEYGKSRSKSRSNGNLEGGRHEYNH